MSTSSSQRPTLTPAPVGATCSSTATLWEQVNGPVPAGHRLKSLDGNRQNTDPSNWIAIPHGMAPRLSGRWHVGYDAAPDELKPVILAVARLDHAARLRGGHRRPGGQPGRRHREAAHG
jgi:hypothetical protein